VRRRIAEVRAIDRTVGARLGRLDLLARRKARY
jgi:hypothetical protein